LFDKAFTPGHLGVDPKGPIYLNAVLVAQQLVQADFTPPNTHLNMQVVNFWKLLKQAAKLQGLQHNAGLGQDQGNFYGLAWYWGENHRDPYARFILHKPVWHV
jgi:hypothetical protein